MLALVAGFVLVAYLLAPGAIYRLAFSFFIPSKRFQRNRTEEVVFSVLAVSIPFLACWILLCHTPVGRLPHFSAEPGKTESYRQVFASLLSDTHPEPTLLDAYRRVLREQIRFIVYLWIFCAGEGLIGGTIVAGYGNYPDSSLRKRFCDIFLLRHVSEWQVLFTVMTLPKAEVKKVVEVDVLSSDTLYKGRLVNWFTDKDGNLAGIFLEDASRFRRDDYLQDKASQTPKSREDYWRPIPGAKLYIAASSITNYNIRYVARQMPVEKLANLEKLVKETFGKSATIKQLDKS